VIIRSHWYIAIFVRFALRERSHFELEKLKKVIKTTPDIGSKPIIPTSRGPILMGYMVFR
jgi:hypothetical protein